MSYSSKKVDISASQGDAFAVEEYAGFESVQKAAKITEEIFLDDWNQDYVKRTTYQGYEISWAVYDLVYHEFSFSFTEIDKLWECVLG